MYDSTGETHARAERFFQLANKRRAQSEAKPLAAWRRGGHALSALSSMTAPVAQIAVCCRFRPQRENILPDYVRLAPGVVTVRDLAFTIDRCFGPGATQEEVFEAFARERVLAVLEGRHASIVAYGQTGSGKTHSMFGSDGVLKEPNAAAHATSHGLVLRSAALLFEELSRRSGASRPTVVTASFLEVYNDRVHDLLAAPNPAVGAAPRSLALREAAAGGVAVEGLSRAEVHSAADVATLVQRGAAARTSGAMRMNARSSRGHGLLQLHVTEVTEVTEATASSFGEVERTATLSLLDLAGMETSRSSRQPLRSSASTTTSGDPSAHPQRREETRNINQSLYALGTVVERLASSAPAAPAASSASSASSSSQCASTAAAGTTTTTATRAGSGGLAARLHVPWRDSKLTRLLQGSLGGAAILLTLRSEAEHLEETLATLRFGMLAKAARVERATATTTTTTAAAAAAAAAATTTTAAAATAAAATAAAAAAAEAGARRRPEHLLLHLRGAQEQAERAQRQLEGLKAELARSQQRESELARRAAVAAAGAATAEPWAPPPPPPGQVGRRQSHEQRVTAGGAAQVEPSGPSLGDGDEQTATSTTHAPPAPARRREWRWLAVAAAVAVLATIASSAWPGPTPAPALQDEVRALQEEVQAHRQRVVAQMRGQPSAPLGARLLLARRVRNFDM